MKFKTCLTLTILLACNLSFKSNFAFGQVYKENKIKSVILKNKKIGDFFKKNSNTKITLKVIKFEDKMKKDNKKISKRIFKGCLGAISGAILGLLISSETTPGGMSGIGYGIYVTLGFASAGCLLGFFVF